MTSILVKSFAGATVMALFAAGAASATSVSLSYAGSVSGFRTVTITEAPVTPVTNPVSAGAFYMNDSTGTLGTFEAWCVDLTKYTTSGTFGFTITDTPFSNSYGLDADDHLRVQAYFDANYSETLTDRTNRSAAFQMGLWEVLYDDDFSLTDNTAATDEFRASSSTSRVNDKAAGYLAAAQSYTGGAIWDLSFLESDNHAKQNLVTATRLSSSTTPPPIPLPGAGLLLLGGLAGLGAAARRRKG